MYLEQISIFDIYKIPQYCPHKLIAHQLRCNSPFVILFYTVCVKYLEICQFEAN